MRLFISVKAFSVAKCFEKNASLSLSISYFLENWLNGFISFDRFQPDPYVSYTRLRLISAPRGLFKAPLSLSPRPQHGLPW